MNCSICYNHIIEDVITECNHIYCKECLDKWFDKGKNSCPLCRREIKYFKHGKKTTKIFTGNLTGLELNGYVKFDILNHSTESYKQGAKFKVIDIDYEEDFIIAEAIMKKIKDYNHET